MTALETQTPESHFIQWFEAYRAAGWSGAIPLPVADKGPPPSGVTGGGGRWPSDEDLDGWERDGSYLAANPATGELERKVIGNVGLRLERFVIGLDVDHYDDKCGGDELAALEAVLGGLPPTWTSSARPAPSGIRYYQVVGDWEIRERKLNAVEVIRFEHRYAVVPPSIHPGTGAAYQWRRPDGVVHTGAPPSPESLPFLPVAWCQYLHHDRAAAELRTSAPVDWPEQTDDDRPVPVKVTDALRSAAEQMQTGGRHPTAVAAATELLRYWSLDYPGARDALEEVGRAFIEAATDPTRSGVRSEQAAAVEWAAIVAYQTAYVEATEPKLERYEEPCALFAGPDGHRYTETGNGDRLVALHGEVIRYVPRWGSWLAWDGRRWCHDHDHVRVTELAKDVPRRLLELIANIGDLEERKRLLTWASRSESSASLAATVRLARTTPSVAVDHQALDADHLRLTVANGDLDLVAGELQAYDPDRLSTKLANVRYEPSATAPEFEQFLEQILPDAGVRAYLQRFAGYCLTGSVTEQMIGIWHGAGANGKSTLINIFRALLGDYAAIAKRELLVASHQDQHPTALVDLFGARLATCVELREGAALDEARVKALTGGDTIAARRMREDWWHFEPTHKLVVATNHRPQIRADDPATWRRVHLVPFEVTIPADKIDRDLGDRIIKRELSGVLNWAMCGLADWHDNGLSAPERVRYATAEYRADADTVARFMSDEGVRLEPGSVCGSTELREIHERWCEDNGETPRSHWQEVQRRLKELGAEPGRTSSYRYWRGVSVTSDDGTMTRDDAL